MQRLFAIIALIAAFMALSEAQYYGGFGYYPYGSYYGGGYPYGGGYNYGGNAIGYQGSYYSHGGGEGHGSSHGSGLHGLFGCTYDAKHNGIHCG